MRFRCSLSCRNNSKNLIFNLLKKCPTNHFKISVCLHRDSCEAGDIFRSCETFRKTYTLLRISVGGKDALINKTLIFGPNYACDFSVKWGRKNVAWTNVIMTFDSCLFIDDDPRKLFPFFLKIMRSFSLNAKAAD